MNYWPSKKGIIVSVVLLACLVSSLWYVGHSNTQRERRSNQLAYASKKVNLSASSSLATFTTAEDFYYLLPTSSRVQASTTMAQISQVVQAKLVAGESIEEAKKTILVNAYTAGDIKLIDDESSSSLKNFGLAIGKALAPLGAKRPAEAPLVVASITKYDPTIVSTLERSRAIQDKALTTLLAIPTPRNGTSITLNLVNSLGRMTRLLKNMERVKDQPVLALESSLLYTEEVKSFGLEVMATNLYFHDKGITFTTQEGARVYFDLNK